MAMEATLDRLEARIEEMVEAYETSKKSVAELGERVAELEQLLEQQGDESSAAEEQIKQLENQRDELTERLEKVLALIDSALEQAESEEEAE